MSEKRKWWEEPLRVIQTNLQVRDTSRIIPEQLAAQIEEMDGNALCFNVGGIYAWYNTKVRYHYQNEYLPTDFDLLKEVIRECHKRGIKFIARFDFSKASDSIYQNRPEWFVRDLHGEPEAIGEKRFGEWSKLLSVCINSDYRRDAVAIPALDEVMTNYDIDGIFYNAPHYIPCWCKNCRRKYKALYGKDMPERAEDFEETWAEICVNDNITTLYKFIKEKKPDLPMILYFGIRGHQIMINRHNTDMICTEAQNILSRGWKEKPPTWLPSMIMKVGRAFDGMPYPFGIIHSSPGMDWRHTGLPTAEYLPWMSQIPASGGSLWHSVTGVPETITDKRVLKAVGEVNSMIKKVENEMDGADYLAETAVLWDGSKPAQGWADALMNKQIQFEVVLYEQASLEKIRPFRLVVVPEGWRFTAKFAAELCTFVCEGGKVLFEGRVPDEYPEIFDVLGISKDIYESEYLTATYVRFEGENNPVQAGMEETELIELRGRVQYCRPAADAAVLATMVPPFSSFDAVGAPPERASLTVSHTDIPMCVTHGFGKGESLYFPFSLSSLIEEYKLEEHYRLLKNAVDMLLGEAKSFAITGYQGLQATVYQKNGSILIHLVNECGSRPLQQSIPLHDLKIKLKLPNGAKAVSARQLIDEKTLSVENVNGVCRITVPTLDVWECLLIETK